MILPTRYRCLAIILFSGLAVGLLFAKCFSHGWTYDDTPVILANQDIRSWSNFLANQNPGRPLRELSYWLDYTLWGFNPAGFMLQNLAWHALSAGMLGCLLSRLGVAFRWALAGALLFLAHPLTVEVAANAGHRKDSLCLALILLAVVCHHEACRAGARRWRWLSVAVLAYLAACLAKQHALVTPMIWVVVELATVPPGQRLLARRPWVWLLLLGIGGVGAGSWFLLFDGMQKLRVGVAILLMKFNVLDPPTLTTYYQMVAKAFAVAASKLIWPVDLAPEYTFSVPDGWLDPWIVAAALLLAGYVLGGVWLWRNSPLKAVFWAWVGLFWLPVMNLWPLAYLVADRYLYTPLAGLLAVLVLSIARLPQRWNSVASGLIVVLLIGLATLTWRQVDIWESDLALWTHVSQVNPRSATAFINLSTHAINVEQDYQKGREYAERALTLNHRHPYARKNYAVALERLGQFAAARREYLRTYELFRDKNHPVAREVRMVLRRNFGVHLP